MVIDTQIEAICRLLLDCVEAGSHRKIPSTAAICLLLLDRVKAGSYRKIPSSRDLSNFHFSIT